VVEPTGRAAVGETNQGNVIAGNAGSGVVVLGSATVQRNLIYGNGGLPVDLGGDGPTPNDPGDADEGPNRLQNFPVITAAAIVDRTLSVRGTLDGGDGLQYAEVSFFAVPPDPAGAPVSLGGRLYPWAGGTLSFAADLPADAFEPDWRLVAVATPATDASGNMVYANTSEYSPAATPTGCRSTSRPTRTPARARCARRSSGPTRSPATTTSASRCPPAGRSSAR
jgi:hypothetical protein